MPSTIQMRPAMYLLLGLQADGFLGEIEPFQSHIHILLTLDSSHTRSTST